MGQTVYLDLFFIINFSMDFLCFYLAGTLLGSKLSVLRMLLGATVGGIYADISLFLPVNGLPELILHIAVCGLMCIIVYGTRSILVNTCVYTATSAVLGGFMTATFELLNTLDIPFSEIKEDGISAWTLLFLATVSAVITLLGGRFFRRKSSARYTDVRLEFQGKTTILRGFCDSGNLLRDPISGKPCIVADKSSLSGLFSSDILKCSAEDAHSLSAKYTSRIRLIPAKTATGTGMLMAVRLDAIYLNERQVDALLALSELGENDGCQALVPCQLLM